MLSLGHTPAYDGSQLFFSRADIRAKAGDQENVMRLILNPPPFNIATVERLEGWRIRN